ncbi:unnamed protein product [Amoebophrya sp. A120]|nr:unnamed protein product [Amoebophrya sp. A120]|eukprot:GSA120T00007834001.1
MPETAPSAQDKKRPRAAEDADPTADKKLSSSNAAKKPKLTAAALSAHDKANKKESAAKGNEKPGSASPGGTEELDECRRTERLEDSSSKEALNLRILSDGNEDEEEEDEKSEKGAGGDEGKADAAAGSAAVPPDEQDDPQAAAPVDMEVEVDDKVGDDVPEPPPAAPPVLVKGKEDEAENKKPAAKAAPPKGKEPYVRKQQLEQGKSASSSSLSNANSKLDKSANNTSLDLLNSSGNSSASIEAEDWKWNGGIDPKWEKSSCGNFYALDNNKFKLPATIYDKLYPYQRHAVGWMWNLYKAKKGGIFADEMGLGKTVMVCAFLAGLSASNLGRHFLIVLPNTLFISWTEELRKWVCEVVSTSKSSSSSSSSSNPNPLQDQPDPNELPGVNFGPQFFVRYLCGSNSKKERQESIRKIARCGGALLTSYGIIKTSLEHISCVGPPTEIQTNKRKGKNAKKKNKAVSDDDFDDEQEEEKQFALLQDRKAWDCVICDEAHQLKERSSQGAKSLRQVSAHSKFLLTGTPYQNNLGEIWSLADLAMPGVLGNFATFTQNFSDPIVAGSKRNASSFAVLKKDKLSRELKNILSRHFLRRDKAGVLKQINTVGLVQQNSSGGGSSSSSSSSTANNKSAGISSTEPRKMELPPKKDVLLFCELSTKQKQMYSEFLNSDIVREAKRAKKSGIESFKAISLLKKLCDHPLMCLPFEPFHLQMLQKWGMIAAGNEGPEEEEANLDENKGYDWSKLVDMIPDQPVQAVDLSCKLSLLNELVPKLVFNKQNPHRVLIFSYSTRMLDLIQSSVLRPNGVKFLRIDGAVELPEREKKIQKFENDTNGKFHCMCLSTKVGGVGLTLVSADRVILVEPGWSPAIDQQAMDRAHRLGQTKEVVVYRVISHSTIEDKMFRVQVFKQGLCKTALGRENQQRYFNTDELKTLFTPIEDGDKKVVAVKKNNQSGGSSSSSSSSSSAVKNKNQADEENMQLVAADPSDQPQHSTLQLLDFEQDSEKVLQTLVADVGEVSEENSFWKRAGLKGFADYAELFQKEDDTVKKDAVAEEEILEEVEEAVVLLKSETYDHQISDSPKQLSKKRNNGGAGGKNKNELDLELNVLMDLDEEEEVGEPEFLKKEEDGVEENKEMPDAGPVQENERAKGEKSKNETKEGHLLEEQPENPALAEEQEEDEEDFEEPEEQSSPAAAEDDEAVGNNKKVQEINRGPKQDVVMQDAAEDNSAPIEEADDQMLTS